MGWDLDERRRAMLQEMGLRVWWPMASEASNPVSRPVHEPVQGTLAPSGRAHAPASAGCTDSLAGAAGPEGPPGIQDPPATGLLVSGAPSSGDWAELFSDVSTCSACALCQGRRAVVFAPQTGPGQTDWVVVGEPPDADEERAGAPFAGDAGRLLDNMLSAVGVRRDGQGAQGARLSNVVRCRPAAPRNPEPAELAACAVHLWEEIKRARPKVILAMGRFAAASLLAGEQPELAAVPLARLRGSVHRVRGNAIVVTHHPTRLLRAPADKAQAWADLCLARAVALGHIP